MTKVVFWDGVSWAAAGSSVTPSIDVAELAGARTFSALSYIPPTTNVCYVSPTGNDSNSGTVSSPKLTLSAAANLIKASGTAASPATVVIRGGSYPLSQYNPGNGYVLRFQAYPGEEVWIDGSETFTSPWTSNGNGTWTTDYTAPTVPALGTDVIDGNPNAILPDMCFYGDVSLHQVTDNSTPALGQFSVNRTTNKLTIAQNPAGQSVRYANLVMAFYTGSRIDLLGIGVRRFRCASGLLNNGIYYGGSVPGTIIENCRFHQMGRNVFQIDTKFARFTSCTFTETGQTALGANKADNLTVENCAFIDSNVGKWRAQPTSGVIKMVALRDSTIRHNYMVHNHKAIMIWWDVSCTEVKCYGNYVDGVSKDGTASADTGIFYESSDGGIWDGVQKWSYIVANTVVGCYRGIAIIAAGFAVVANNTISAERRGGVGEHGISIDQDRDDNHGVQVPAANCPWWSRNNRILNNRIKPQDGGWQLLAFDTLEYTPEGSPSGNRVRCIARGFGDAKGRQKGGYMVSQVEGNWFAPASGNPNKGGGSVMALIGRYDGSRAAFNSPAAVQINDVDMGLSPEVFKNNYKSATDPLGTEHDTGVPVEPEWATFIRRPTGSHHVGNPLPSPIII